MRTSGSLSAGRHSSSRGRQLEAFHAGDWNRALQLIAQRRGEYEADARRMRDIGLTSYRVRIIEMPLTPYLQ